MKMGNLQSKLRENPSTRWFQRRKRSSSSLGRRIPRLSLLNITTEPDMNSTFTETANTSEHITKKTDPRGQQSSEKEWSDEKARLADCLLYDFLDLGSSDFRFFPNGAQRNPASACF